MFNRENSDSEFSKGLFIACLRKARICSFRYDNSFSLEFLNLPQPKFNGAYLPSSFSLLLFDYWFFINAEDALQKHEAKSKIVDSASKAALLITIIDSTENEIREIKFSPDSLYIEFAKDLILTIPLFGEKRAILMLTEYGKGEGDDGWSVLIRNGNSISGSTPKKLELDGTSPF